LAYFETNLALWATLWEYLAGDEEKSDMMGEWNKVGKRSWHIKVTR
jgi:hypothetical protein